MRLLKYFSVLILALIIGAAADEADLLLTLSKLPECPLGCILKASGKSTCPITDSKCMCTDKQLQTAVQSCILSTCTIKQALTSQNITSSLCGNPVRSKQTSFRVMNITLIVISSASVLARFLYKLLYTISEIGWDDYCILITLILGLPSVILNDLGTLKAGLGRDIWTLEFDQITDFIKYVYVTEVLYFGNLMFLRLSLLFFYARIFKLGRGKKFIYGTIAFNTCLGTACILAAIFQCQPVDFFWLRWSGEYKGTCINVNALGWSNASIGIALDFWMLGIPMFQVKRLHLPLKKKIAAGFMFSVGTFVTIVSILRLHSLLKVNNLNATWDQYDSIMWSTIEVNVGIICACMPTLRMILIRIFPKLGGTRTGSGRYYDKKYSWRSKSTDKGGNANLVAEKGPGSHIEQDMIIEEDDKYGEGRPPDRRFPHDDEVELMPMHDIPPSRPT